MSVAISASEPTARNWPGLLWLSVAIALVAKAWLEPHEHTTYPCFEAGARCWFFGENMYEFAVCGHEYRYTPTFTAAFTVLGSLPTQLGGALWGLLNVAVLYAALRRLTADLLPGNWTRYAVLTFHGLTLLAAIRGLWAAQSNTLIFALIALGACAVRRGQWWQAAFFLVAPAFIKVWPLAAALLFVACWPRQLLTRMLAAGLFLLLLPFATVPADVAWNHLVNFLIALLGPMQGRHIYRDAWTIWETLAPPVSPAAYQFLQGVTALLTLAACVSVCRRSPHAHIGATFVVGLWCVWQLVFGPGVERNTLCLIAPLLAWAVVSSLQTGRGRGLALAAYGLVVVFSFGALERALVRELPLVESALPIGVSLFGLWLLREGLPIAKSWTMGHDAASVDGLSPQVCEGLRRAA